MPYKTMTDMKRKTSVEITDVVMLMLGDPAESIARSRHIAVVACSVQAPARAPSYRISGCTPHFVLLNRSSALPAEPARKRVHAVVDSFSW